jgi:glucose-1-phosphate adenylyltransferase
MLDGVLVADGAVIQQATIERSVVGVRAKIDAGTHISHSILFGADAFEGENRRAAAIKGDGLPPLGIGPGCVIRKAIIDKNARIGAECRLENLSEIETADGDNYCIRDGVIIIPKGAVLPPGTTI